MFTNDYECVCKKILAQFLLMLSYCKSIRTCCTTYNFMIKLTKRTKEPAIFGGVFGFVMFLSVFLFNLNVSKIVFYFSIHLVR